MYMIRKFDAILSVFFFQGKCFMWTLTGGRKDEPTHLHPKSDFVVSNRYALKCLFSPDSTYVLFHLIAVKCSFALISLAGDIINEVMFELD